MDDKELDEFRMRVRVIMIENLVLKTAFLAPVLSRRLSSQESRDSLLERLDTSTEVIDRIYGGHFHDPALTALYAEEAREVVKKMKATVCRTAKEWDDLAALDR